MRPYALFILALFLLNFPIFAQEPEASTLAFIYAYWLGAENLDFHVVDALTGENLYSFESEERECPKSMSPDGRWLIYSLNAYQNYLYNFITGEIFPLGEGYIAEVFWNLEHHLLSLHYNNNVDEHGLQVYEMRSSRQILNMVFYSTNYSAPAIKFDGTDLLYAFVPYYDGEIEFHRQNPYHDEVQSFTVNSYADWWGLSFSPDNRYLLGVGVGEENRVNLVDMPNDTVFSVGESGSAYGARWLPTEDAMLAYFNYDETDTIELLSYNADSEAVGDIDAIDLFSFSFSSDASYALYAVRLGDFERSWGVMNVSSGERYVFDFPIYDISWISANQLVYTRFNTENNNVDLYFYDAVTGESRQLTDTADRYEQLNCAVG